MQGVVFTIFLRFYMKSRCLLLSIYNFVNSCPTYLFEVTGRSADSCLVQVKETIAREAASREQHKLDLGEREARDREGEDSEQLLSSAPPSEDTPGSTGNH